ncbi:GntR family transcriptional regulator [Xylophilus sp. GOD-11R]|uniref:GntR family transcriptional regulator n=1 Tax=Xylophilus sp. GOD-11R TaxID=3089814 RepID=UPI00298BEECD|nr:GntR family transcriptional regulator [Xylophilus sp. GOD-11R]WPB54977.1 GntR family transcriptional regulator [Xylophilus sp. GOD-11R]
MDLKISTSTVQKETVRKLREAVLVGHFKPGERLVETSLAEQLGVSRPSLREALRVLVAEHLVVHVPHRGPSVAVIDWPQAEQIYHTRTVLEGELASLAAQHAGPEDLSHIEEALQRFDTAVRLADALQRVEATTDFYDAIISASANEVLGGLIRGLLARINLLRAQTMSSPGRAKHSARELRTLFEAIAARDRRSARAAAIAHVMAARQEAHDVFHAGAQSAGA